REEGKPILLSIGYSTCHWCHVMERESFEDEAVGEFLNKHFVAIKLDREERPDVDKIYMTAVQAMGQGGGWPLNVFLTPDLKPFYGGTYFPPQPKFGRPSFLQLLGRISELWGEKRKDLTDSAGQIAEQLKGLSAHEAVKDAALTSVVLTNALKRMTAEYDPQNGGFGRAPKFPRPSQPAFILRAAVRTGDQAAVKAVLHTCERMAAGGMYDQLGGGFARYSVDAKWLVPHFEKMLYDNAQLLHLYLDAYLVSGEARHADVARDIVRYVLRDMTHAQGGFYSAEDADSEGHEGKFYCWTREELTKLLSADEFKVAERYFGITEDGNFEDHSHPQPLKKLNVLSIVDGKLSPTEAKLLAAAKQKLFAVQAKRVRPHLDDKVLASWNGLMLGALARAGVVLNEPAYLAAAEKNLAFLQAKLWDAKTKTLYHRWRDGERDSVQLLDSHAYLLEGVIHLYEATLDPKHLDFALALESAMSAKFYDPAQGGYFQSPVGSADLLFRSKEDYDGAEPSGNNVATVALLKLSAITDDKAMRERAEKTLRLFAERLTRLPQAVPNLLLALDFYLNEPFRVVVAGDRTDKTAMALLRGAHSVYQPNKVVLGNVGAVEAFAKTLPVKGGSTAYLCTGTACQPPTSDPDKVAAMLKGKTP
ncbi:MAG: thioredoxin domain-containing protein, partial [Proteobacteria bacterium]|nr:thioredoxin domain-containing protein [Pseudomonadota bacterium]